jgi:serine/threonine-protein kinase
LAKRFRIEELIGSGGYASVYRATDLDFGYPRAIKEVSDPDHRVRTQFRLEAQLLINTSHPNVPRGYEVLEDRGRMYFVMEYIRGKDLEELLNESLTQRGRPLDEAQTLRWMMDVCDALSELHGLSVPIIHRDIKPANIKITPEGRPVLIDFGLAKLQRRDGNATATAAQGVSPGFAPPEQYMAKGRTDARTDVYGMGATLFACLTGKDPPEAPARLLAQTGATMHGSVALQSPRRLNPRISEPTERLTLKALELSPAQRQQSAQQLHDELGSALNMLEYATSGGYVMPARRPNAPNPPNPPALNGSGKRVAVGAVGGLPRATAQTPAAPRGTAQSPAVPRATAQTPVPPRRGTLVHPAVEPRSGKQAAVDGRTGRQAAAAADGRSGKQPAVPPEVRTAQQAAVKADRFSSRQPVVTPFGSAAMAAVPAPTRDSVVRAPEPRYESLPMRAAPLVAVAEHDADTPGVSAAIGAWVRLGSIPLSGFAKWMLAFSGVEVLWGMVVLAVGVITLLDRGKPFPLLQFVLAWGVAVLLASVLGGQALSRPVLRRGELSNGRRAFQGTGLFLYTIAVHGVAIWGATIFAGAQANTTLAIVAFMLFGANVLVVGALAVANLLG